MSEKQFMESLSFQYPIWYLFLCVLVGLAYTLLLYFRDKTFREQSSTLNWILGSLRFLGVTFLSVLLLSPLLKSIFTETKKPLVILAQDQSESILTEMSEEELQVYQERFQSLGESLKDDYEVKEYAFGRETREGINFEFTDKVSNLSELLNSMYDLHSNQNLGAVVMATDGIFNEGSNPIYASTQLSIPIYTVALGDTTPRLDLILKNVLHNRIAYLGDRFTIQTDLTAQNCQGQSSSLRVYKIEGSQQELLQQEVIRIDRNDFFTTRELTLEADKAGVQRYRITLGGIPGEVSTANNSKDIFVDVLDARQKILIVANAPHPDLTAIRQSIENNKNYELSISYSNDIKENPADFDFIILHQLPGKGDAATTLLETIKQRKIPHLFIIGTQSDLSRFNQVQNLVTIQGRGGNINEVQARLATDFSLFSIDENLRNELPLFPPLVVPFGEFEARADAETLLKQQIGRIDTEYPLLVLGEEEEVKVGVLCGEGIWKWRLFDFLQRNNHFIFNEFLSKTIQYLSIKDDKRKFRVNLAKNIFDENEPAIFDAELYNDSYELINDSDIQINIVDEEGKEYPYTFNKTSTGYQLNAGILPIGNYTFRASTLSNGRNLFYTGQFSVQPIQKEVYENTANHNLLKLLSDKYGGALVYPDQLNALGEMIKGQESLKPIIYENSRTRSVIHLKWIFFLLLGLLCIEWFFRRYFGAY